MGTINCRELTRHYKASPAECVAYLLENLESKALKPGDFSIRDMFVALHPEGRGQELLSEVAFSKGRGAARSLREAAQYVSTGDFSNITGQIIFNRVKEAYDKPSLLHPQLCTVVPTEFLNGERVPGVGGISPSLLEAVGEGQDYPDVGINETWLDTKATVKHGAKIGFTREMVIADRTGLMLKQADDLGEAATVNVEKETIDTATGATTAANSYNRNGVSMNTYLTAGAYINDQTGNALDGAANEWRAIEDAMLLYDAMTNPNTGEPIGVPSGLSLLVPTALVKTAERIVHATSVSTVDMRAQATTIRTDGGNPLGAWKPTILSNQYVKARTGSTTKWYLGDFKKAVWWMQVWAVETLAAANNDEAMFNQDIWSRHRVSYRGVAQMVEPRYLIRNDT